MKLLITRPLKQSERLSERLKREGHEVFSLPLIEIVSPADGGAALQKAMGRLEEFDWLVATSVNAVFAFTPYLDQWPPSLKVAAAGPKTAAEIGKQGRSAFFPGKNFGAKGLIEFFSSQNISGKKILYPSSSIARKELVIALQKMDAEVEVVPAYHTQPTDVTAYDIHCLLNKGIEGVLFFSPSAVAHFFDLIRPTDERIKRLEWIPVGSTTANALKGFLSSPE